MALLDVGDWPLGAVIDAFQKIQHVVADRWSDMTFQILFCAVFGILLVLVCHVPADA